MSLAKLTSLSTQTLSLLLERQRLQTFTPAGSGASPTNASTLHAAQITRNLRQLRTGILALERKDGKSEALGLLRNQYGRMRGMLGAEADNLEPLEDEQETVAVSASASTTSLASASSQEPLAPAHARGRLGLSSDGPFAPYTDDPERGPEPEPEPSDMLQMQRQIMDTQDVHLDHLSRSVSRQRDLSLQINGELEVHSGLLEELDHDLDHTDSRLTSARHRLGKFAKGMKGNGSTMTIAALIFVLLILIVVFKT